MSMLSPLSFIPYIMHAGSLEIYTIVFRKSARLSLKECLIICVCVCARKKYMYGEERESTPWSNEVEERDPTFVEIARGQRR